MLAVYTTDSAAMNQGTAIAVETDISENTSSASGSTANAQFTQTTAEEQGADSVLREVLSSLQDGKTVRIHAKGFRRIEGAVYGRDKEQLFIQGDYGETRVPIKAIEALWDRGRETWTGLKMGAGAGLLGGVVASLIAVALGGGFSELDSEDFDILLGFYTATTAAGAVVGSAIGTTHSTWRQLYRSPAYNERYWAAHRDELLYLRSVPSPESTQVSRSSIQQKDVPWNGFHLKVAPDFRGGVHVLATLEF